MDKQKSFGQEQMEDAHCFRQARLSSIIRRLAPESLPEGCTETEIPHLKMYRFLGETIAMPKL